MYVCMHVCMYVMPCNVCTSVCVLNSWNPEPNKTHIPHPTPPLACFRVQSNLNSKVGLRPSATIAAAAASTCSQEDSWRRSLGFRALCKYRIETPMVFMSSTKEEYPYTSGLPDYCLCCAPAQHHLDFKLIEDLFVIQGWTNSSFRAPGHLFVYHVVAHD